MALSQELIPNGIRLTAVTTGGADGTAFVHLLVRRPPDTHWESTDIRSCGDGVPSCTRTFDLTNCPAPGLEYRAVAVGSACNAPPEYTGDSATVFPFAPRTPTILKFDGNSIQYHFKHTNSLGSVARVRWNYLPSGMVKDARYVGGTYDATGMTGTVSPSSGFSRPAGTKMMMATAIACDLSATDTEVALLPDTDTGCDSTNSCCSECVGDPVRTTNGNMRYAETDPLPSNSVFRLARTYDSLFDRGVEEPSAFGPGWTSLLDSKLTTLANGSVTEDLQQLAYISTETNEPVVFRRLSASSPYALIWPRNSVEMSTLTIENSDYVYRNLKSGVARTYSSGSGRLIEVRSLATGEGITVSYPTAALTRIEDLRGNWALLVTLSDGVVQTVGVEGRSDLTWSYIYDSSSGDLLSVRDSAENAWRTYTYDSEHNLLEISDVLGNELESHQYDSVSGATDSTGPSGSITSITRWTAAQRPPRVADERVTTVTYESGETADYYSRLVAGKYRTAEIVGACTGCGGKNAAYAYDTFGNVVREQDSSGYLILRTFDLQTGRTLLSQSNHLRSDSCDPAVSGLACRLTADTITAAVLIATPATKTVEYAYTDAVWPNKPTLITSASIAAAGENTQQQLTYDSITGQVLSRATSGWTGTPAVQQTITTTRTLYDGTEGASFAPSGGPFAANPAWLALPQPSGLQKTNDGARTDVSDVTSYVYYPVDASVPSVLRGRLAAVRNAVGHITRWESYDVFGNATRIVDPNGVATEFTFDALGRSLQTTVKGVAGCDTVVDPLCATDLIETRTYRSSVGPPATSERPSGAVTSYDYDERARVESITQGPSLAALSERLEYDYEEAFNQKSEERFVDLSSGSPVVRKTESYAYDASGRLVTTTHADATTVTYQYDDDGRVTGIKDENHASPNTTYTYDPAGRQTSVAQTLNGVAGSVVTSYAYDTNGDLLSVTDPNGNVTSYDYDDFGRMRRQVSPVTGTTTYSYDPAGNLLTTSDANGAVSTRTFDALGRILSASSSRSATTESVAWVYDTGTFGRGRVASMTDPTGETTFTYDRRGMLARESRTVGTASYVSSFQYDADGNRTKTTYPSGKVASFVYDHAGRPVSASVDTTPIVTSAKYLPYGPMTEVVYGNGTVRNITYDARYLPETNRLSSISGTIADYLYGHDAVGNITVLEDVQTPGYDRNFAYDDLHRLTTANTGVSLWGTGSFAYDAMGNVTNWSLGANTKTFAYDALTPKLTSVTEGAPRIVTYDAAGNELTVGLSTNTYSPRNLLAQAGSLTYGYDGRGVRALVSEPAPLATLTLAASTGGGRTIQGVVAAAAAAPAGGMTVLLVSNNAAAVVPSSVTIPMGAFEASFDIATTHVVASTTAMISASFESTTLTRALEILPPAIESLTPEEATIQGGQTANSVLTLNAPAPVGGVVVEASNSHPSTLSVPSSITIPEGEDHVTVVATSPGPVATAAVVTITVSHGSASLDAVVTIVPPPVASIVLTPSTVEGGTSSTATVTLQSAAAAGTQITFASSNGAATAPSPATVTAGALTTEATVTTSPVATMQSAVITATLAPASATAVLVVQPSPIVLQSFTTSTTSVVGTNTLTGTVTLANVAPTGGVDVELAPFEDGLVPPYVTVPAGVNTATFTITTPFVTVSEEKVLSARHGLVTLERTLEIEPPVTIEDIELYEPGTIPQGQDERRLSGYPFGIFSTTGELTMTGGKVTGPIPWDPYPASSYSLYEGEANSVTQPTDAVISITSDGMKDHEHIVVVPSPEAIILRSVTIDNSVIGGDDVDGWVELSAEAPSGGFVVNLSGTRAGLATVPTSVTVPEGETGGAFTVTTQPTSVKRGVQVRATYAAQLRTAILAIQPFSSLRSPETTDLASDELFNTTTVISTRSARARSSELNSATETEPAMLTRYSFYTPELQLLAQSELTSDPTPSIEHEYIWFGGQPVAQIASATGAIAWYFNDHLGTPILQTDAAANVIWRVEREPYGRIFEVRAGASRYQPLAFPGQEDEGGETAYNIFRWYRGGWGRYTQSDPAGFQGSGLTLFQYSFDNPVSNYDPHGAIVLGPNQDCPRFAPAREALQKKTKDKKCCNFFKGQFGKNLKDLIDSPTPIVVKKWPLTDPNALAETPCNAAQEIWLKPEMCGKVSWLGGGNLTKILLHELAHVADCAGQKYPAGGGVEEGAHAEIECFGTPLSTQTPGKLGPNTFPIP